MGIPKHVTFESCTEKIDIQDIEEVEAALGVRFPKDFVECMLENNEGCPVPCVFDYEEGEGKVFHTFYSLSSKVGSYYILTAHEDLKDCVPDGVIPIGYDAAGNYICFDYSNGKHAEPIVVFVHHEFLITEEDLYEGEIEEKSLEEWQRDAISPVAETFTEFLSKLYEGGDE
ncbi:SMI1/KNR4 family protein [Brevibacillus sp. HB1.4B]|uniref:SMI1/KNR4 family protein n=1 Tax=Brevibacillus TaxID=55080 RepID=UPI00156B9E89|nr:MULTISPECIES: SMI1/KNR4 family protein [unclassified Brevibacillus]NRS17097.1 SMI1/KNR4 family protein [Brevibacillus sp. HB1.4B]NTU30681.1 SMI1/KNR4 family protein [Brevibacillus sp. HB1.1]